jgi:exopolyphosphatase / guanosine-5'-triphosphate,3'-diphosphate pyrophosphatase
LAPIGDELELVAVKKIISTVKKNRWAAIDIGSNAIRMMIADYTPFGLKTVKKYRIPIRLGADVFSEGRITGKNLRASARAFEKFKRINLKLGVQKIRAVGTSALREAKNKTAFVEFMRRKANIKVEVIDGIEEAQLIFQAIRQQVDLENHNCLLIDIGGGSVELTICQNGLLTATQSFPFGTVRTLNLLKKRALNEENINLVIGEYIKAIADFINSNHVQNLEFAVGTGGNLEALGKLKIQLLKKSSSSSINQAEISQIIEKLRKMSVKDRIEKLKMRPDRADVIIPAILVAQAVLRQSELQCLIIPYVGLRDGILWSFAKR